MVAANGSSNGQQTLGKRARSPFSIAANTIEDTQQAEASDEENEEDEGPMPMPAIVDDEDGEAAKPAMPRTIASKKRKTLKYEKVYLDNLPSADRYYSMYMLQPRSITPITNHSL